MPMCWVPRNVFLLLVSFPNFVRYTVILEACPADVKQRALSPAHRSSSTKTPGLGHIERRPSVALPSLLPGPALCPEDCSGPPPSSWTPLQPSCGLLRWPTGRLLRSYGLASSSYLFSGVLGSFLLFGCLLGLAGCCYCGGLAVSSWWEINYYNMSDFYTFIYTF